MKTLVVTTPCNPFIKDLYEGAFFNYNNKLYIVTDNERQDREIRVYNLSDECVDKIPCNTEVRFIKAKSIQLYEE